MNKKIIELLILNAYDIEQKKNKSYTRIEAINFDPLISTLYQALNEISKINTYENKCEVI